MLKKILAPLASLKLTVVLLALSIFLILVGTLAQVDSGIWQVQKKYFHSTWVIVDMELFLPRNRAVVAERASFILPVYDAVRWVKVPMLGGYTLGLLLLLNLVSAHATRFKFVWKDLLLVPMLGLMFAMLWQWQQHPSALLMWGACGVGAVTLATLATLHGKRTGVILTHLGLILLLVGEGITSGTQVETRMSIHEGETANHAYDIREVELAVVDPSPAGHDKHTVISARRLAEAAKAKKQGDGEVIEPIRHPDLPFEITVEEYHPNSVLLGPREQGANPKATAGTGQMYTPLGQPLKPGVGDDNVDMPSAYVKLSKDGQDLGRYLVSIVPMPRSFPQVDRPQEVRVGDQTYTIELRFKREYKPYTIRLHDFAFDRYLGTNTPKNYSSEVRLVDPRYNVDRDVLIRMNEPLRYRGETFYQSGFDDKTEKTTILQIVRNPGLVMPYTACIIGGLGLLIHFGMTLVGFLLKRGALEVFEPTQGNVLRGTWRLASGKPLQLFGILFLMLARSGERSPPPERRAPSPARSPRRGDTKSQQSPNSYTLEPPWPRASVLVPLGITLFAIIYVTSHIMAASRYTGGYDLSLFGQVPVVHDGRVQPLDSLARTSLRKISGRERPYPNPEAEGEARGKKLYPAQWLLETMTGRERGTYQKIDPEREPSFNYNVVRIDFKQVIDALRLNDAEKPNRKYFSIRDVMDRRDAFEAQIRKLETTPRKSWDLYLNKLNELLVKVNAMSALGHKGNLHLVPSLTEKDRWVTWEQAAEQYAAGKSPEAFTVLTNALRSYVGNDPAAFNSYLAEYHAKLDASPVNMSKVRTEYYFNRLDPFFNAAIVYVGAFLCAAISWIGFSRPMARSAFALLALGFLLHTTGLIIRVYLTGRPPVTNLASSAVFIAWGSVALAGVIEHLYRRSATGIGSAVGAAIGCVGILIYHNLAKDGDTMAVLQAVLDTNLWLFFHVLAIVIGYVATFVAGVFAVVHVIGAAADRLKPQTNKTLSTITYGVTCFALLFSFVGTILGGIWADQSWGRFWGWDPKENGAVLLVLANAILLHSRWAGWAQARGVAALALFGNIVTSWSWFGTNMLGVGLHSYGFMESAALWLSLFMLSQLVLIVVATFLPAERWATRTA